MRFTLALVGKRSWQDAIASKSSLGAHALLQFLMLAAHVVKPLLACGPLLIHALAHLLQVIVWIVGRGNGKALRRHHRRGRSHGRLNSARRLRYRPSHAADDDGRAAAQEEQHRDNAYDNRRQIGTATGTD